MSRNVIFESPKAAQICRYLFQNVYLHIPVFPPLGPPSPIQRSVWFDNGADTETPRLVQSK